MPEVPTGNNARPATVHNAENLRRWRITRSKNAIFERVGRYLDGLAKGGILDKHRLGSEKYYINRELAHLLFNLPRLDMSSLDKKGEP